MSQRAISLSIGALWWVFGDIDVVAGVFDEPRRRISGVEDMGSEPAWTTSARGEADPKSFTVYIAHGELRLYQSEIDKNSTSKVVMLINRKVDGGSDYYEGAATTFHAENGSYIINGFEGAAPYPAAAAT
ncbi:hypothetical protein ACLOJK_021947 [Asimina triloba]